MTTNILVTGGSGFIGSHLVDLLLIDGNSVTVIDNLSTGLRENENKNAKYIHKDIKSFIDNPNDLIDIINLHDIEIIYHLAASADVYLSVNYPEKVYEVNLLSSIAIANACSNTSVSKLIFASTSAVYGEPEYLPVDENHPTSPVSPYGLSKLGFEQYLKYHSMVSDKEYVIFRLPNVFGPRQRPDLEGGVIAIFENLIRNDEEISFYGDGSQTRDWVHVDDVVKAFCLAKGFKKDFEIFSLGSEVQTSLNQLYKYLLELTDYKKKPIFLKERSGDIKHMVMSYKNVNKALNWKPIITLKDGLVNLINN